MGTQFTSRLTQADRRKIADGIVSVLRDISKPVKKRPPSVKTLESLSGVQLRKFGDATVSEVLKVSDARGFFTSFEESELFEKTLSWLKRLLNDAKWAGFNGIIEEHGMEDSANPVRDLSVALREITEKVPNDPFRFAATAAATAILAETVTRNVSPNADESRSKTYGRKLATFTPEEMVRRYISSFVYEVVSRTISMSDPESSSTLVRKSAHESQRAIERIARRAIKEIKGKGKLNDVKAIHKIVLDELKEYSPA